MTWRPERGGERGLGLAMTFEKEDEEKIEENDEEDILHEALAEAEEQKWQKGARCQGWQEPFLKHKGLEVLWSTG